jgi:excisionase family DNA binding protein
MLMPANPPKGVTPMSNTLILWDKIETAKRLGISVRGLDRLIRDQENPLPHVRVGRLIKFRPADVMAWVNGKVTTDAPRLPQVRNGGGTQ